MTSDKNIHEPETSCCTGYVHTRKRETCNNTAKHLDRFSMRITKCNSGEILDQKIIYKADEAMLLVKCEEPYFLLMPG